MRRDSNINQFIPLHFYEVTERVPDDEHDKIVVVDNNNFFIAWYSLIYKTWQTTEECRPINCVIAWATFSPGWVTGSENFPEKWSEQ